MNYETIYLDCNLSIESSSIQKRQSNPEGKTDYVWIEIEAENEECCYTAVYKIEYVLYNEGWLFETYQLLDQKVDAYAPSEEIFEQLMEEQSVGPYKIASGPDLYGNGGYIAKFEEVDSNYNEYLSMTYITTVEATYNIYRGWEVFISDRETASATLKAENLIGTYKYSGSVNLGWDPYDSELTVYSVDDEYIHFRFSIYVDWGWYNQQLTTGNCAISIADVNQKLSKYDSGAILWFIEIPQDESNNMFIIVLKDDGFRINAAQNVPYPQYWKMEKE